MKYDTVVIGAGASGMCAALALARHGQRVALVEQSDSTAPLLRRFRRRGLWCDPGFHHAGGLQPDGPLSVVLRYLDLEDLVTAIPLNPDGYDIVHFAGREPIRFPVGVDRVRDTLINRFPASRKAVEAYVGFIESLHRESAFLNIGGMNDLAAIPAAPTSSQSLDAFLAAHGAERDLRDLLGAYGYFLCGAKGDECPMTIHALVVGSFYFAAHTFERGGDELVDAFEQRLGEVGVDVRCGFPVTGLEVDSQRRLRGVRLADDEVFECQHCVCTTHPRLLLGLLDADSVRRSFRARLEALEDTCATVVVYLAAEDPPPELRRSNVFFLERNGDRDSKRVAFGALNNSEGGVAVGCKSLCLIRPVSPTLFAGDDCGPVGQRSSAYEKLKEREVDGLVEAFYSRYPEQRGRCSVLDSATPCTYESYTSTIAGSAYGAKHSVGQFDLEARTPVKGLYLGGQGVLAPGISGAMISGLVAVSHIVGPSVVLGDLRRAR